MMKPNALSISKFIFSLLVFFGLFDKAYSHASGTSLIDVHLFENRIEAMIDVNTSDMAKIVTNQTGLFYDASEIRELSEHFLDYFRSRVLIHLDGVPISLDSIKHWNRPNDSLLHNNPNLQDTSIIVTLISNYPKNAKHLNIQVQLFAELRLQAISKVQLFWQDKPLKTQWLSIDDEFSQTIDSTSIRQLLSTDTPKEDNHSAGFLRFVYFGFIHILPYGLDHILFVLGLFLFSLKMKPLIAQITAFTIAHSITLCLTLLGIISLPEKWVEAIIALSIAAIAFENVFHSKLNKWRWMVVFAFGLLHGMGFAGVLAELEIPKEQFISSLLAFNIGVEIGQLCIVTIAMAATFAFWNKDYYRKRIVIPSSLLIGVYGLYLSIERMI